MASFRAHVSLGIASGILGAIGLLSLAFSDELGFISIVFVVAVLGSIMPDMDSDSGVPFHVTFGSFSLVAAALVGLSLYHETPLIWERILLWTVGTFALIYLVVGYCFKRFTRHRGMAHSLPAALLAGLVTFFLAVHFSFTDMEAFVFAMAMIAGYLGHLVLDELYAAVNFHGTPFIPNKALGSALKFTSDDRLVTLAVYGAILFLSAGQVGRFANLAEKFWRAVG
jgi:membrane-bound metal-dependent hydrolase YbcI (DUF457 family)